MPEITRRRVGELLRKLFEVLLENPEGLQARLALAELGKRIKMSPYEAGSYESGGSRFDKIVRFATVDCVKAGWFAKNKGKWSITEAGEAAYRKYTDPEAFYREAVRLYREWKASLGEAEPEEPEPSSEPAGGKSATITIEEAEEQAWAEIEEYLRKMKPYDVQDLVADLLKAMGYHVSWVSPPGKDAGIDILASVDPLGMQPPRIKVQVKRQAQAVDVNGLRSFMALLSTDDVGIFVSVGGFTRDAQEEARTQENRRVTLIDVERLFDLWVENYGKLSDEARARLPLRPIYFFAPQG